MYLTLVSAYLIVAYVAAKQLNFIQLSIINVLFVVMALMTGMASINYMARAVNFREEMIQFRPDELYLPGWVLSGTIVIYGIVLFSRTAASVYFMVAPRRGNR